MIRPTRLICYGFIFLLGALPLASAHPHGHPGGVPAAPTALLPAASLPPSSPGVTGHGKMRFRVLYKGDHLPKAAGSVLKSAHGGFAIDRRAGKGEVYFALPGAGIIQISGDLKTTRMLQSPEAVAQVNMHNTTIWYGSEGTPYLSFPANSTGQILTTTLDGKLVHTLEAPSGENDFDQPAVRDYFMGSGNFVPTDVEQLDGLFYVTTGYSSLDFVLTARIASTSPFKAHWHDLAFGGKGNKPGQFGTGHGITVPPGRKRIDVADRPNSEIERFTRYGHYRSTLKLPQGSFPCDIDYSGRYAVVGCLHGPNRKKGAPIYLFDGDTLISTIMAKEDLGLENFQHIHNAVLRKMGGKFYVIAQAWNPGDFAILEQVTD